MSLTDKLGRKRNCRITTQCGSPAFLCSLELFHSFTLELLVFRFIGLHWFTAYDVASWLSTTFAHNMLPYIASHCMMFFLCCCCCCCALKSFQRLMIVFNVLFSTTQCSITYRRIVLSPSRCIKAWRITFILRGGARSGPPGHRALG